MFFEFKRLNEFTEKDFKEIKPYTFHDGMVRPILLAASQGALKNSDKYILTILRHNFKFIIGWSLLTPPNLVHQKNTSKIYHCFVRPLFRKLGLGTKIFNETMKNFCNENEISVYGWNKISNAFYSAMKEKKDNITII